MRRFWDRRASENPWFFITNTLDYSDPDLERFWASGEEDLDTLLGKLDAVLESFRSRGRDRLWRGADDARDRAPSRRV